MKRYKPHLSKSGTVLILALWTLGFLSILTMHLGIFVRQKIILLSRIDKRSCVQKIAEAGVRKARAVFEANTLSKGMPPSAKHKEEWFNNPNQFQRIPLGPGSFEVIYRDYGLSGKNLQKKYGISDEEQRININVADRFVITRLVTEITALKEPEASALARAIIDWREYGESDVVGFYSEDFYDNLEFPYSPKKKNFEILDELLLVKGMDTEIYNQLLDFITVYGEGKVNINTAPAQVLAALGLSPEVVGKIILVRRGPDGIEGTMDDYILMTNVMGRRLNLPLNMGLKSVELAEIDNLLVHDIIGVSSSCFRIESTGKLSPSEESMTITCVFDGNSGRIIYWREKRGI